MRKSAFRNRRRHWKRANSQTTTGEIEFECDLTRDEVVNVAEPFILRSVEISKRVLKEQSSGKSHQESHPCRRPDARAVFP